MDDHRTATPSPTRPECQRALGTCASLIRHPRSLQHPLPGWRAPRVTLHIGREDLAFRVIRRRITTQLWLRLAEDNSTPPPPQALYLVSLAVGYPSAFTPALAHSSSTPPTSALVPRFLDQLLGLHQQPPWGSEIRCGVTINRGQNNGQEGISHPGIDLRHVLITEGDLAGLGASPLLSSSGAT